MKTCPNGCGETVIEYPAVYYCPTCTDHWHRWKRRRTEADAIAKSRWTQFSFETEKYAAFQRDAMYSHLHKTPALDMVQVSAHDAFGNPEGSWVTFTR